MTRTVALGAVIGFAITVLVLAVWGRDVSEKPAEPEKMFVDPRLEKALFKPGVERRVERVIIAPVMLDTADAGAP